MGRAARPDLTELAAAKFIECHGSGALAILQERAGLADQLGHKLAAKTWRTMADAAAHLLRAEPVERSLPRKLPGTAPRHARRR